ncbi:MAG: type 1 glutamine amidotransferase [Gaiella sp.]
MRVLSITHEPGPTGGGGIFETETEELGHELTVWVTPDADTPPTPSTFDAIMVFGGAMHPDQDAEHGWLSGEVEYLRETIAEGVPLLGVCLGSQLIARAADAWVGPGQKSEVGWHEVGLTAAGRDDPVLGVVFPERFHAFQWHYYTWELPDGAVLLAESSVARQAYRLGERTWSVQFHPEVNATMLDHWFTAGAAELPLPEEQLRKETTARLPQWNERGHALCGAFLERAGTLARS